MTVNPFFARNFDAEIEAEAVERDRQIHSPAPSFSAEEVAEMVRKAEIEAHEKGVTEGHAAGLAEARAETAVRHADMLERLGKTLNALLDDRHVHHARLEAEMAEFTRDVGARVFPELVQTYGADRVKTEISRIVRRAVGSASLDIRVAPAMAEPATEALRALDPDRAATARIVTEPTFEDTQVEAAWKNGRSRYSFAATCKAILHLLDTKQPKTTPDGEITNV